MSDINHNIRGEYLVDNHGYLQKRMPRRENIKFIANYIFANPCCGANECRKAMLQWRGFKLCDESRGQYASYFYDRYHFQWYHSKIYSFIHGDDRKKRMVLATQGLSLIDRSFQERLKNWDKSPRVELFSKKA